MRARLASCLIGAACLMIAACAERRAPVNPSAALAQLRTGGQLLRCREECLHDWQRAAPQARELAANSKWRELAVLVLQVGYQDDLTTYYLGRAAEGLGYKAAATYYRQSLAISGSATACASGSHICGGVSLPRDPSLRLAAIDRELERPYHRPFRHIPRQFGAPAAAEPPPPDETTPALPGEAEMRAPDTVGNLTASEFIEPPPPAR